jgi:hypothetical protein
LAGALADTASGQQALFASPGAARARPATAAHTLHRLIAELAALATTATITKRATRRAAAVSSLFDDTDITRRSP